MVGIKRNGGKVHVTVKSEDWKILATIGAVAGAVGLAATNHYISGAFLGGAGVILVADRLAETGG